MIQALALLKHIKPKHIIKIYDYVFKKNELDNAMDSVVEEIKVLKDENKKLRTSIAKLEIKLK